MITQVININDNSKVHQYKVLLDKHVNCFDVAVYHIFFRGTIFYYFAPCQSVTTIYFKKIKKKCTSILCFYKKYSKKI